MSGAESNEARTRTTQWNLTQELYEYMLFENALVFGNWDPLSKGDHYDKFDYISVAHTFFRFMGDLHANRTATLLNIGSPTSMSIRDFQVQREVLGE